MKEKSVKKKIAVENTIVYDLLSILINLFVCSTFGRLNTIQLGLILLNLKKNSSEILVKN